MQVRQIIVMKAQNPLACRIGGGKSGISVTDGGDVHTGRRGFTRPLGKLEPSSHPGGVEGVAGVPGRYGDSICDIRALFFQFGIEAGALEDVHLFPWLKGQPLWRRLLGSAVLHPVYHYALVYRQLGLPQESLRLQERTLQALDGVSSSPEWLGVGRYNLACAYALQGERDQALQRLAEALRLRPDLVEWSKQDPDFASLRDDPGYRALYAP